jgi:hypothetical protein
MDRAVTTELWRFVRGDIPPADFEAWLYAQEQLESDLGEALYFEIVSSNYQDRQALFVVREQLAAFLRPTLTCECITLPDMAAVPMGSDGLDERVFATLERVCVHGGSQWWLYLSKCAICGQNWMVAQDERIFDQYFLRRLEPTEAQHISAAGHWPTDFITYERVLSVGCALGRHWRFSDPLSPALVCTAKDLRKERPNITVEEIASLIGVSPAEADRLLLA